MYINEMNYINPLITGPFSIFTLQGGEEGTSGEMGRSRLFWQYRNSNKTHRKVLLYIKTIVYFL